MYHSLYKTDDELQALPREEQPYAVSVSSFEQQIDGLIEAGIPILSPRELINRELRFSGTSVLLTFDDAHRSFYEYAFPALIQRGLFSIFFVTTDFILYRNDSCSWLQLAEMAKQNMWVQSHGKTHQFFTDLSANQVRLELGESKKQIEDKVGEEVSMVSFPGGRYKHRDVEIGKSLDFKFFFTSRVGINTWPDPKQGGTIKRLPLKDSFSNEVVKMIVEDNRKALWYWQCSALAKTVAKSILGNHIYHGLYRRISA
jgi:peptidoglycan/xylan/chitin deacetylase (PgdA/CDA1 family)